jgi:hypothetical protein
MYREIHILDSNYLNLTVLFILQVQAKTLECQIQFPYEIMVSVTETGEGEEEQRGSAALRN